MTDRLYTIDLVFDNMFNKSPDIHVQIHWFEFVAAVAVIGT